MTRTRSGTGPVRGARAAGLAAVALLVAPGGSAGQEAPARRSDPLVLRIGRQPGERTTFLHEKRLTFRFTPAAEGPVSTHTRLRLVEEAEEIGEDSLAVRAEIASVELAIDLTPERAPDLTALEGRPFRIISTRAGRVYRVEVPGASGPVGRAFRDQVESWLRDLGFPTLPAGPARVGDRWADTARVSLAALLDLPGDGAAVGVRTTRLAALEGGEDGPVAVLEVRTEWSGGQGPADAPDITVRGTDLQSVRFDVARGRFLRSSGSTRLRVEMFDGTGAPLRRLEAEGSFETRVVEPGAD